MSEENKKKLSVVDLTRQISELAIQVKNTQNSLRESNIKQQIENRENSIKELEDKMMESANNIGKCYIHLSNIEKGYIFNKKANNGRSNKKIRESIKSETNKLEEYLISLRKKKKEKEGIEKNKNDMVKKIEQHKKKTAQKSAFNALNDDGSFFSRFGF